MIDNLPNQPSIEYLAVIFFLAGTVLVLAGMGIVKIEKVTIKPGKKTWISGFALIIFGFLLYYPALTKTLSSMENTVTPTATISPTGNRTNTITQTAPVNTPILSPTTPPESGTNSVFEFSDECIDSDVWNQISSNEYLKDRNNCWLLDKIGYTELNMGEKGVLRISNSAYGDFGIYRELPYSKYSKITIKLKVVVENIGIPTKDGSFADFFIGFSDDYVSGGGQGHFIFFRVDKIDSRIVYDYTVLDNERKIISTFDFEEEIIIEVVITKDTFDIFVDDIQIPLQENVISNFKYLWIGNRNRSGLIMEISIYDYEIILEE